ncbi:MAG: class I SAM-dependent methyltransferase [Flavobacteriaceae bacterium]
MKCRNCNTQLKHQLIDLGYAPPSNAYLEEEALSKPEITLPLRVAVCENCWLVQTEDYSKADELFDSEYAYFSSTSKSWLNHAKLYCERVRDELDLGGDSFVVEIASNDGYLLKNFVEYGVPCLGIEPTESTAAASEKIGVPVVREFFGKELATRLVEEGRHADLIIGNNVYAHVPDIKDFTNGMKKLLKPNGVITLEFPHLLQLLQQSQFDTIYHEHFSYLSLGVVRRIFEAAGLRVWNVDKINTHGGSLRIYGCHENASFVTTTACEELYRQELDCGLEKLQTYANFQHKANKIKNDLISFLIDQKRLGKKVVAYGAAAKGNTLVNYAGIKSDLISVVYDAAQSKQGRFLPGSHIPIEAPEKLDLSTVDYVIVFPWNIISEIKEYFSSRIGPKTKLVTAVPELKIH